MCVTMFLPVEFEGTLYNSVRLGVIVAELCQESLIPYKNNQKC